MSKIIIRGQTVSINKVEEKDYKDPSKSGKLKIIYFTVADRDRHPVKGGGYETDGFYFCKAVGETANHIEKYCSAKDTNGKLVSRKIYLEASPRQYKDSRKQAVDMSLSAENLLGALQMTCPDNVKGKTIDLSKDEVMRYDNFIFEVKEFRMDDYVDLESKESTRESSVSIKVDVNSTHTEPAREPEQKLIAETEMPMPEPFTGEEFENPFL